MSPKELPHAGIRMRIRRVQLGMSQQELGDAIGTRQEGVSQYEARGPKSIDVIARIAEALDCRKAWLAWGEGEP
jgi:transcriptional regulator with XRE-family HTH domain